MDDDKLLKDIGDIRRLLIRVENRIVGVEGTLSALVVAWREQGTRLTTLEKTVAELVATALRKQCPPTPVPVLLEADDSSDNPKW